MQIWSYRNLLQSVVVVVGGGGCGGVGAGVAVADAVVCRFGRCCCCIVACFDWPCKQAIGK